MVHLLWVALLEGDCHDPALIWWCEPRSLSQLEAGVSAMISKGLAVDNVAEVIVMPINSNLVGNQPFEAIIMPLDYQPFDPELGLCLIWNGIPITAVSWIG